MYDLKTVMSWLEGLTEDDWEEWYSHSEVQNTAKAAMELLKEQEAKSVIADKRHIIWDDSYDEATYFEDTFYRCPSCNRVMSRTHMKKSIHFCEECGQAVKWDD